MSILNHFDHHKKSLPKIAETSINLNDGIQISLQSIQSKRYKNNIGVKYKVLRLNNSINGSYDSTNNCTTIISGEMNPTNKILEVTEKSQSDIDASKISITNIRSKFPCIILKYNSALYYKVW